MMTRSRTYLQVSIGLMLVLTMIGFISLGMKGCTQYGVSGPLEEPGKVVETIMSPGSHGGALGVNTDLDLSYHYIGVAESYTVVFKCQHGKFVITGSDNRHKELWSSLAQGDSVVILYKERYYERDDGSRVIYDYDFLSADKVE